MQIYTQNLNHARKNMIFFKKVNRSTGQRVCGGLKGLFWVCLGLFWVCEKITPISSIKPDLHLIKKIIKNR